MRTDGEIRDDVIGELEWDPPITTAIAPVLPPLLVCIFVPARSEAIFAER
jgi:hypothetical protein